jgi:hypothetical protein
MTRDWTVTRSAPNGQVVLGVFDMGGGTTCSALERLAVMIPDGRYQVQLVDSPDAHAGILWAPYDDCRLPTLLDVPGRTAIHIHAGNHIMDTKGCILVAADHGSTELMDSRPALTHIVNELREADAAGDAVWLTVRWAA